MFRPEDLLYGDLFRNPYPINPMNPPSLQSIHALYQTNNPQMPPMPQNRKEYGTEGSPSSSSSLPMFRPTDVPIEVLLGSGKEPKEEANSPQQESIDNSPVSYQSIGKMTKKESKRQTSSPQKSSTSMVCRVCNNGSASLHYGGIVCGGCKIFFARAVGKDSCYVCSRMGRCQMEAKTRNKCRSCRFQLCLKANMSIKEVGKLREMRLPENMTVKQPKEEAAVVEYFDSHLLEQAAALKAQMNNPELCFVEKMRFSHGAKHIANKFINLERFCDNDHGVPPAPSFSPPRYDVNVKLSDALICPTLICARVPITWKCETPFASIKDFGKKAYCRTIVHYIDWITANEDIMLMRSIDKLALIARQLCAVMLFTFCYKAFTAKCPTILLPDGNYFEKADDPKASEMEVAQSLLMENMIDEIRREIIDKMILWDITEEEFVLMKLVILVTPRLPFCDESNERIRFLKTRYEGVLLEYLQTTRNEKGVTRMADLITIVKNTVCLSELPETCLAHLSVGSDDMRGDLSYDLHLRSYQ